MNHAKIAAALHALADAFLADVESVEQAVTGKKGGKKAAAEAAAVQPANFTPPAHTPPSQSAAVASSVTPEPEPTPAAPSVTLAQVNKAVLTVAAKNRDAAVAVLGKFGLANTVNLPAEKWQAVYDAFEEEIAKIDAAAVQVAQASLV
jgi:hypothetical protein